jgi:hypothetical protein
MGNFLFDNYKQALTIITEYTPKIEALKAIVPGLADEDFIKWREEELEYLKNMQEELEYDTLMVAYVEALQALKKAQCIHFSSKPYYY